MTQFLQGLATGTHRQPGCWLVSLVASGLCRLRHGTGPDSDICRSLLSSLSSLAHQSRRGKIWSRMQRRDWRCDPLRGYTIKKHNIIMTAKRQWEIRWALLTRLKKSIMLSIFRPNYSRAENEVGLERMKICKFLHGSCTSRTVSYIIRVQYCNPRKS